MTECVEPGDSPEKSTATSTSSKDPANDKTSAIGVTISQPSRVGEGVSSYMVFHVVTRTTGQLFGGRRQLIVSRRFSDFVFLHDRLRNSHAYAGIIVPPAPDKSVVGAAKLKMAQDESQCESFVERRRAALERFLNRTVSHPSLRNDPQLIEFLSLEETLPRPSPTSGLSGVSRLVDRVTNLTIKMEDTDSWFAVKIPHFDRLEEQLGRVHASMECLVVSRRQLAAATSSVGHMLSELASCESHHDLAAAASQLSTIHEANSRSLFDQATADLFCLSELVRDHIGLVGAVKNAFVGRTKAWQYWQETERALARKRESMAKAEMNHRLDKVGLLRGSVSSMEERAAEAEANFKAITDRIKAEVDRFETCRCTDFREAVKKYSTRMAESHAKMAARWRNFEI